jgi:tetratricopeptide (TPR) repeat protein
MPTKTYMVVDPRHDHAFRVPRPDESARFGTSNVCTDCHTDRDAGWAAAAVEGWYGPHRKGFQTWTEAFSAHQAGRPEAASLLLEVATDAGGSSIARATAFEALGAYPSREATAAARRDLAAADPLLRLGALRALRPYPAATLWPSVNPLLADPVLAVRIEAASLLADVPLERLRPEDRARLAPALDEYVAAQRVNADRPEHRVNLGMLFLRQSRFAEAEAEFLAAGALDPGFAAADVGLAELYARRGRDAEGETVLRAALARLPETAELHHALGLALVRQRHGAEALAALERAAALDPANPRYAYVYAVALSSSGRAGEAIALLETVHARRPNDRDTLLALATLNADAGRGDAAVLWAERLVAVDPAARPLLDQLRP